MPILIYRCLLIGLQQRMLEQSHLQVSEGGRTGKPKQGHGRRQLTKHKNKEMRLPRSARTKRQENEKAGHAQKESVQIQTMRKLMMKRELISSVCYAVALPAC